MRVLVAGYQGNTGAVLKEIIQGVMHLCGMCVSCLFKEPVRMDS